LNFVGKQGDEDPTSLDFKKKTPKFIVFMMGGISHAEIRMLKNLEQKYRQKFIMIIGSTSYLKPNDYLERLSAFSQITGADIPEAP
jgi:hypothetical protein